jgi:hypothetical protein
MDHQMLASQPANQLASMVRLVTTSDTGGWFGFAKQALTSEYALQLLGSGDESRIMITNGSPRLQKGPSV